MRTRTHVSTVSVELGSEFTVLQAEGVPFISSNLVHICFPDDQLDAITSAKALRSALADVISRLESVTTLECNPSNDPTAPMVEVLR